MGCIGFIPYAWGMLLDNCKGHGRPLRFGGECGR